MLVASNTTENDIVLLTSLEGVDAGDLNLLVEIFLERSVELHVVDDVRSLSLVRCDHADLSWYNTGLEELRHNLFNVGSFRPVSS